MADDLVVRVVDVRVDPRGGRVVHVDSPVAGPDSKPDGLGHAGGEAAIDRQFAQRAPGLPDLRRASDRRPLRMWTYNCPNPNTTIGCRSFGSGRLVFRCVSRRTGLTCTNARGHGWWIGRYHGYRLF